VILSGSDETSAMPSDAILPPDPSVADAMAALGQLSLPLDIGGQGSDDPEIWRFGFNLDEIPFTVGISLRNGNRSLQLTGDFGVLPFSAESQSRRRRLQIVMAAARQRSGLGWELTQDQRIRAIGELSLVGSLTPMAAIAASVARILAARPYLDLVKAVAGEP
jgi:hypothetical protein